MTLPIDRDSPVPLYHQIAEAIRYQIATGAIPAQSVLPPLREAAELWGANLHTVRKAYAELAADRIVATRVPTGTVVLPPASSSPDSTRRSAALERFLAQVVERARDEHGIEGDGLVSLLQARIARRSGVKSREVYVTECSETQCRDLAAQLMAQWRIAAVPWPLGNPEPPAGGRVVATYFHYRDLAHQWPRRVAEIHFVAIRPDPHLAESLMKRHGGAAARLTVHLCEREASMLTNIAADLAQVLPSEQFHVVPQLVTNPGRWLSQRRGHQPLLFSPRLWGELDEAAREDPRAVELRYVFDPRALNDLGRTLGWKQA